MTLSAIVTVPAADGDGYEACYLNPAGLNAKGENLYLETEASGAPQETDPGSNGAGTIYQGYVEASNVNATEELVNMIQAQRAYELNSRAIRPATEDAGESYLAVIMPMKMLGSATLV